MGYALFAQESLQGNDTLQAEIERLNKRLEALQTTSGGLNFVSSSPVTLNNETISNDELICSNYDDSIINFGAYITVRARSGNDYIEHNYWHNNYVVNAAASYAYSDAGDGDDTVYSFGGTDPTLIGGAGDDYIYNSGLNAIITGGDGADTVINEAQYDSNIAAFISPHYSYIDGGAGKDQLINWNGEHSYIDGGDGNDELGNTAKYSTVYGGDGNDWLWNTWGYVNGVLTAKGDYVLLDGGAGDDEIASRNIGATLNGGAGNDSLAVDHEADRGSLNGGAGNDTLKVDDTSINITVNGGSDNDVISLHSGSSNNVIEYASGDGNDVVYGLKSNDTIRIDGSSYSTVASGLDVIVSIDSGGSINLKNASGKTLNISGNYNEGDDEEMISNNATNIVFRGTEGDDDIENYAGGVTILAGGGDDYIYNSTSYTVNGGYGHVTIDGGAGNDTVNNNDPNVSIDGGAGKDFINVQSWKNVTVKGGAGNDFITELGLNNVIEYAEGDGNDIVEGFDEDDTISITDGSAYSTATSGSDVIVSIGSGSLTLKNASDKTLNIMGGSSDNINTIVNTDDEVKITGTTGKDYIINSGENATIQAGKGNDTITGSNYGDVYLFSYASGEDVITNFGVGDTLQNTNGTMSYKVVGDDVVVTITKNGNSGNITLQDAGGHNFELSDNALTINDVNYINNDKDNVKISGTGKADYITNSGENVTIQAGAGNDTITGSNYGEVYLFSYASGSDVIINFGVGDTLRSTSGTMSYKVVGDDVVLTITKNGNSGNITLQDAGGHNFELSDNALTINDINEIYNAEDNLKINGTTGKDYIINSGENATIQAGKGNDTITGSNYGDVYLFSNASGEDVITNFGVGDTLQNTNGTMSYKVVGDDVVVTITKNGNTGNITLQGAGGHNFELSDNALTINDINEIYNAEDNLKINGTTGKDYIINSGENVTIQAGAGNDTITGSNYGEVYLFSYASGSDVIINFGVGDTLRSTSGTMSYKVVGDDVVLTITKNGNSGNITLQDAGGHNFELSDNALTINDINEIYNAEDNLKINGTTGKDYIINIGENVTIQAGGGNDTIEDNGSRTEFRHRSYEGNDVIYGYDSTDTINITETVEYDTMLSGNDVVIYVLDDEITLKDAANKIINIKGGYYAGEEGDADADADADSDSDSDDQTIFNRNSNTTVNGTGNDDYIIVGGSNVTVNAGRGNDTVELSGSAEVINYSVGDGYDTIEGVSADTRINITGSTYSTTRSGSNTVINVGNGQMLIRNYSGALNINGTLEGSNGGRLIDNLNDNSIVSGTDNPDTINNSGNYVVVNAGKGADLINGINNYTTTNGGDGNDTITGEHWRSVVNGGAGADLISLEAYWYNTVDGGNGNDSIITGSSKASINGGANDDYISLDGGSLTVKGGKGNDTIRSTGSEGNLYQYTVGDGNDLIYGFNANDTLTISGGYTTLDNGNDIIVYLTDDGGNIRLMGAKGKAININNTVRNNDTVSTDGIITPQDVILMFMKSLDDSTEPSMSTMLDNAIRDASGGKFTAIQDVIDAMIDDCTAYNNGDSISGWRRFLLEKCDIDLDNDDTGAITGSDAGGSDSAKTAENIVSADTELNSSFTDSYFNIGGLNVYLAKQTSANTVERINYNDSSLSTEEKKTWQGLQSGWLSNALSLGEKSFGSNFSFGSKSTSTLEENSLYVTFKNVKSNEFAGVNQGKMNSNGETKGPLTLSINTYNFASFRSGKVSDAYMTADDNYIGNSYFFERILAHEFTHAVMDANILNATGQEGLPQFVKDGLAELVHGADDGREFELRTYAQNPTTLKNALDMSKLYQHYPAYAGGYMFMRYIAKQFSSKGGTDNYDVAIQSPSDSYISPPTGIVLANPLLIATTAFKGSNIALSDYAADLNSADATALTKDSAILGTTHNDSLNSGSGSDKLYGGDGNDTLIGNRGNDTLYGDAGNDQLTGGDGDDYIYGGVGNDTMSGGNGEDWFIYEDGRDVITDYAAGVDKIQLESRFITSASVSGSDVILYTDGGSITVKDGKDQKITVIDRDGIETTQTYGREALSSVNVGDFDGVTLKSSKIILGTPFSGTVDLANFSSKVKTIDATKTTDAVELIGNDNKNTFKAGSGGSTLDGAGSNDKLYGGDGVDVFVYDGLGKDKIYNYSADDRIVFTVGITKAKLSGKNLKVTVEGGGVLTVNKIFETPMTITTSDGQTNNYIFDKKHKDLDAALENANSQLPADDYWFLDQSTEESPLTEIVDTDAAIDYDYDQMSEALKPSTNALFTSARYRQKK